MSSKKAIILINVGTPDAPKVSAVRKYLTQFLNDKRVIDLPWLGRKLLVNAIIVPFRSPKSTKLYEQLWTENGSPLLYYGNSLRDKLQQKVDENTEVFLAMRYGNPSIKSVLQKVKDGGFNKVVVVPLFPQYASSSTQTAIEEVERQAKKIALQVEVEFVQQFYNNEKFIAAFADNIKQAEFEKYDHIIFSYHGLPYSHINKIHPETSCENCLCEKKMTDFGTHCYKATCYETTRLLVNSLHIAPDKYSVGFQSRLSKNWLHPFTDELIQEKAKLGVKKILVVAPAFVADCLETTIEIGVEYKELFIESGGEKLKLVESLNDKDAWVNTLRELTC